MNLTLELIVLEEGAAGVLIVKQSSLVCSSDHGKVYTEIVPDSSKATLQGIIRGHVDLSAVIIQTVGEAMTDW